MILDHMCFFYFFINGKKFELKNGFHGSYLLSKKPLMRPKIVKGIKKDTIYYMSYKFRPFVFCNHINNYIIED